MKCPVFKGYLMFLKERLKPVTNLNMLFQSENVESVKLLEDVYLLLRGLLQKLAVPAQLEKKCCNNVERQHETGKKYVCKVPECGKSFHRSDYLSEHMKVHSGVRPFACNILYPLF
ncbi:transcription factor Sp5-like [Colias croceus]|uniref:transcription factor Sp5-like n=1 Tax=Colias crocea TaxID=72248 RepID=UPI001E27F848|nr:transcription factor Sp5-like [Colias croceus]